MGKGRGEVSLSNWRCCVSTTHRCGASKTTGAYCRFPGRLLYLVHGKLPSRFQALEFSSIQLSYLAQSPVLTPSQAITSSSTRPRSSLSICCGPPGESGYFLPVTWQGSSFRRAPRGPVRHELILHPCWQLLAAQTFRGTLEACPNLVLRFTCLSFVEVLCC